MLPDLDVLSVMLVTILGASLGDARFGTEVDLHSHANGPADCGQDIDPTLCDSVNIDISEECGKNATVRQSCLFSCSVSGKLWWAVSKGKLEEVNTAIAAGANPTCQKAFHVNYHSSYNMTALHLAAWLDNPKIIVALLNAAVDINLQTTDGATPTYYASWIGSIDALQVLIEHNADVNLADSWGMTPLMWAARWGHLSAAKALIKANASLDVTGGWDNATALYYAAYINNLDIALLLIEHNADVNIAGFNGMTPLMWAARKGQLSVANALIKANASIDVIGGWDNAPALYYAAYDSNPDIALLLIEHNADVNIAAKDGWTPLMQTALDGQLSVAKSLIKANASLDVRGGWANATALYYATRYDKQDIALLLIEHNADVNIAAASEFTPLMQTALGGQLSLAKSLIKANASLDVTGGSLNATALYYAASYNNPDIALLLIEHNADVNIAARDGDTPLIIAAARGQLSAAKALINANANVDVTGGSRNATALHYAAEYNRQDVALLLLQSGADTMITDEDGQTPAETAKHYENYQLADLIENYASTSTTEDSVTSS